MSAGITRVAYVLRHATTRRAPTSAPAPPASPWPSMAKTAKVQQETTQTRSHTHLEFLELVFRFFLLFRSKREPLFLFKDLCWGFVPYSDRTVKVWTGNEMERRGGEWDREMTAGRIRTCVPVGVQARIWSGLLLAPQCPPENLFFTQSLLTRTPHSVCRGS